MLFDLEDYVVERIIGLRGGDHPSPLRTADQINWDGEYSAYTAFRTTRDSYKQAINSYYLSASTTCTPAERQQLDIDYLDLMDSFVAFNQSANIFWPALISLPIKGDFQEGEKYNLQWVSINDTTTGIDFWFPNEYYIPEYQQQASSKLVAVLNENGDYTYSTFTQAIYDDYKNKLVTFQSKVKTLMLHGEGQSVFREWVTPEVMPYETYPELSGYVRGTNSLSIQNAVVRLTDAEGVTHDVVTDSKGYYIFTKEFIYNNVSLGATGSVFDLNMNLLPTKTDGTVLYNTTSKFQNSFFGAVNNRGMNWPQRIVMNKPARRNFKIEFIPDYSNFPSFRGYVKDAVGNAIKDALVTIKDPNSGYAIGQYRKPNGDDAWNYKYNDFGTDKTILTDENGFYEYTSQMVGEWFNKHGFVEYGIPTTVLAEPTRTYEDGNMQRWFMSNEFVVYLIPFKQDANSTNINWGDGTPIYDGNSYSDSRFEYALSNLGQHFYYRDIEMNQNNVFDVNVVPAVGNEVMADKIKITCTPKSQNISGYFRSTTGYVKFVFSNGVSEVRSSGWIDYAYYNYNYDTTMFSEEFYLYSCDSEGRAFGHITECILGDTEGSNVSNIDFSESEQLARLQIWGLHSSDLDVSNLSKLERIYLAEDFYLQTVSGLENCKRLTNITLQNNRYLSDFPIANLPWLSEINIIGTELLSLDFSTIGKKAESIYISLSGMESLQSTNFGFIGHTASSYLNLFINNCNSLLVDDIDSTLQQLVDSGKQPGSLNLSTDMARSSDSDSAFDTLSNSGWSLNFGSKYFESNEIKKSVVMYVDPSFGPSSNQSQKSIYLTGEVTTTTGYFRLKSWYDNGSPQNNNIYGGSFYRTINVEFDDTYESRPVEIYSTDEYGRPSGTITQILLNNQNNEDFKNIVDVDFSQATEITNLEIRKFGITSLNLTSNVMLSDLIVYSCGKIDTLFVNNLVSLETIYIYDSNALTSIEGFDTLTSLYRVQFENCQMLDFVSYSELTSINEINISNVFKYDSTHVDTILSELKTISDNRSSVLNAQLATKQAEHPVKLAELQALSAQEPTVSTLGSERDALQIELDILVNTIDRSTIETLRNELAQLISNGEDQALIDAKQAEVAAEQAQLDADQAQIDTKQAELVAKQLELDLKLEAIKAIDTQLVVLDAEIADLNSQISNLFVNSYFNSDAMARTSASDADYNALIAYGWQLYLGSTFFAPYTEPVKGYITLDWDGNDQRYLPFNYLVTTTGYYKFKDGAGNLYSSSGNNYYFYANKGVLEFWSTDSFGRPGGEFTGLGFGIEDAVVAVDFDNLTSLSTLSMSYTDITTLDITNLNNLDTFECLFNNKLVSITGLNLLYKLRILRLRECTKLTNVDTSGLESLRTLYLDSNSSLSDIDISNIGSKDITGLNFDTEFVTNSINFPHEQIVELPDGKFMVAGDTIARLNSDGSIDDTFTYITLDSTTNGNMYIYAMEVQADGKVLVGGEFDVIGGVTQSAIARINTDGTIDETFLAGDLLYGPVWDAPTSSFVGQKYIATIKVQPDGKILIGGFFVVPSVNMYGLVRLNSDGTIDSTFINGLDLPAGDVNGFSRLGGAYEDPRVIELQPDGKILVGGSQWNGWFLESGYDSNGAYITKPIYRLNSDGTLDTTFDTDNNLVTAFYDNGNNFSYVNSIVVDSTGRIVLGGWFYRNEFLGEHVVNNLVRLNSDGTFNHDFSTIVDEQGITRSFTVGKINRKSLFFIGDKLFVGAYGRPYILDENDNISEYISLNGGYEYNQLTWAIFTSNNKLVIVGNFSGNILTWPTEIYVGGSLNGIAAFNYETYNFKSLSSLTIYNQDFETPKYLDVHENIIEINYNYFRTFTSTDLDTLLTELDTNGRSNGSIYTGYVARTEASDVAYNNLQSKGWSLGLGSYFIGPNEEPSKGYIHYEDTSVNESINFLVYTETNYFVVKYPDGTTETRNNGWVYYDFNSSIPVEERIFEIYGADQFGRPTDSITDILNINECSSVDFGALKKLRAVGLDQNDRITTLNLDGVVSLESIFANTCPLLETISIVGCTASKQELYMNSCPLLDIDAFLIQLDETGSLPHEYGGTIYADQQWGNGLTPARTHASDVAAESLQSKGFDIRVAEPAGDSIQIITHGSASRESWYDPNDYGFGIQFVSSTGYAKIVFDVGSEFKSQFPDGIVEGNGQKWTDYNSVNNYAGLFGGSTLTSQKMTIFSCTVDGTPSGEIRYLKITGMARVFGSLSQLTKLKGLSLGMRWLKAQKTSVSLTGMKLEYLDINHDGYSQIEGNTYITNLDVTPILPTLKAFEYSGTYQSNYPGTSITGIDFTNLERIQLQGYNFGNTTLSGFTKMNYLYLDSCYGLSIDFEDFTTKYETLQYFRISGISNSLVNIINLDAITTKLPSAIFMNYCNLVGNTDLTTKSNGNFVILNTNVTSISGNFTSGQLNVSACNQLTNISLFGLPNYIQIDSCQVLQSVSIDKQNQSYSYLNNFNLSYCPQLTSLSLNLYAVVYLTLRQLPLLSSINTSLVRADEVQTVSIYDCGSLTQIPSVFIDNCYNAYLQNLSLVSVDFSNNNRLREIEIYSLNSVSGLNNKEYLYSVNIANMSITSLNFSNSFTAQPNNIYRYVYLQLYNISGLTSLNIDNTKLRYLRLIGSTTQNLNTSVIVDSFINTLSSGGKRYGTFYFQGFNTLKTAASAAAYTNLINNGWMLQY